MGHRSNPGNGAPSELRGALEDELAHARASVARLEAALGEVPPRRFAIDRLVPVKVVAKQLRRSPETIRMICRTHHLGCEIGGTWFVDLDRLSDYINRALS